MTFELSEIAKTTANYINTTDRHIFLTGKAGTGKTTFLKYIIRHSHKKAVVAAPTGIAAINAEGVTLHSLLQLPFGAFIPERIQPPDINAQITTLFNLFSNLRFNASKRNLIQELELLIIDEVSMLRADLLDCIDHMLRYLRKRRNEPFGGLQMLFIGDLLQLPPVVKDNEWNILSQYYSSSYFFEAKALDNNAPIHVELDKIYRQSDQEFIELLNRFRENAQTREDLAYLNSFYSQDAMELGREGYIHLTTHNRKADDINAKRLDELDSEVFSFPATIEGDFPENLHPTGLNIDLKVNAQVMFIKNDPTGEGRFFNGRIGKISKLNSREIRVVFDDGNEVKVSEYKWENKRYTLNKTTNEIDEKIIGSFEQYPLKLAWAVTVHKSQGLTFEKAILDLSASFTQGQIYVALSRLTSLKGLVLSSTIPDESFGINASMKAFADTRTSLDQLSESLAGDRKTYLTKLTSGTFDFSALLGTMRFHEQSFDKQENRSLKQKYHEWTKSLFEEIYPIKSVSENFLRQVSRIVNEENDFLPILSERVEKATAYFTPILTKLSEDLRRHDKDLNEKTKIKTYRKELKELEQSIFNKIQALNKVSLLLKFTSENKVLTKKDIEQTESHQSRERHKPVKKKDKTPTAEISFNLFKEGKSVEDIAHERGLVPGTIEGHLGQYVELSELNVFDIVDKQKIVNILSLIKDETTGSGEIKAKLGDEYTWGEVRLAMAHYRSTKTQKSSE